MKCYGMGISLKERKRLEREDAKRNREIDRKSLKHIRIHKQERG